MTGGRVVLELALLIAALGLIAMCLAALACGPAAPVGGGGAPDNPFATGVAPTVILPAGGADGSGWNGTGLPPPPTRNQMQWRYPNLDSYFIRKIREYEAAAAEGARGAAGSGQPMPTLEVIDLFATIDAHEYVDGVRHFLEENGALRIKCVKFSSDYVFPDSGQCAALVQVSLLRGLAELPGVIRIEKVHTAQPASDLGLPSLR